MHRAALPGNPGIPELYRKRLTVRKICKILLSKKRKIDFVFNFIFTNPPYSNLRQVFAKLRELDKPFAVLVPLLVLATQYFQNSVEDMSKLQIIIPKKRLGFIRAGIQIRRGNFDTVWLCYGLNLDFGFIDYCKS